MPMTLVQIRNSVELGEKFQKKNRFGKIDTYTVTKKYPYIVEAMSQREVITATYADVLASRTAKKNRTTLDVDDYDEE